MLIYFARFLALVSVVLFTSCGDQNAPKGSSEAKALMEQYAAAFNKHDPHAMVSYWSESGELYNPITGETVQGREKLEEQLKKWFTLRHADQMELKLGGTAAGEKGELVQEGLFKITFTDEREPVEIAFEATLIQEDLKWQIKKIRIVNMDAAASNAKHLQPIAWLLGQWEDKDEDSNVKTRAHWDKHHNFIIQDYEISVLGQNVLEGKQIIGWDPLKKRIRSWMFDSDGGFGEGRWYERNGSWYVDSHYVLGDGRKASAVYIYTPVDAKQYKWASEGRDLDGEILPNVEPVEVYRVGGGE